MLLSIIMKSPFLRFLDTDWTNINDRARHLDDVLHEELSSGPAANEVNYTLEELSAVLDNNYGPADGDIVDEQDEAAYDRREELEDILERRRTHLDTFRELQESWAYANFITEDAGRMEVAIDARTGLVDPGQISAVSPDNSIRNKPKPEQLNTNKQETSSPGGRNAEIILAKLKSLEERLDTYFFIIRDLVAKNNEMGREKQKETYL